MADTLTPGQRSERMARVRGRGNHSTEIALAKALRMNGVHGWRRHVRLCMHRVKAHPAPKGRRRAFVRPDFVFRLARVVVFVDGCFWHACPLHGTHPGDNREFWEAKLVRNRQRDRHVTRVLRLGGWKVLRIWEHDLKTGMGRCVRRIQRAIRERSGPK